MSLRQVADSTSPVNDSGMMVGTYRCSGMSKNLPSRYRMMVSPNMKAHAVDMQNSSISSHMRRLRQCHMPRRFLRNTSAPPP